VTTSPQVGGPNATITSYGSTWQSLALGCSSPDVEEVVHRPA
jgi:hypothetical protein